MNVEQTAPALVANLLGARGRADNVGEQNRREDPVALHHRGDRSGEEIFDRIADPLVDEK
jgi:hypothetical protein